VTDPPRPPPSGGSRDSGGEGGPDDTAGGRDVPDMIGRLVAERYRVLELLGRGAMGSVYLAEHVRMGRKDALKILSRRLAEDPDAIARFTREARNASFISHENVCEIYDFGETDDGLLFLAMQFVDGETLGDLMEREGPLPPERVAGIGVQVTRALEAAHARGIVHRDLKPHNIMLTRGIDGSELVKVVDFGIAKAIGGEDEGQEVTRAGWIVGTPEYVSPEQLSGLPVDGRSDVYSLGIVLFKALTGALPFTGATWQEVMTARLSEAPRSIAALRPGRAQGEEAQLLDRLQSVVDRALARDAEARYAGAAALGRALEEALHPGAFGSRAPVPPTVAEPEPIAGATAAGGGRPPEPSERSEPTGARGPRGRMGWLPWVAAGVTGGALALAGVGWASGWFADDAPTDEPVTDPLVVDSVPSVEPDDTATADTVSPDPDDEREPPDTSTPPVDPDDPRPVQEGPFAPANAEDTLIRQLAALTTAETPPTVARIAAARDTAEVAWGRTGLSDEVRALAAFVAASALQDLREPGQALSWAERAVELAPDNSGYRSLRNVLRGGRP